MVVVHYNVSAVCVGGDADRDLRRHPLPIEPLRQPLASLADSSPQRSHGSSLDDNMYPTRVDPAPRVGDHQRRAKPIPKRVSPTPAAVERPAQASSWRLGVTRRVAPARSWFTSAAPSRVEKTRA